MAAVLPSAPRHQAPHGLRAKPAAGAADFGRLLQQAAGERQERAPGPSVAPQERTPEPRPAQDSTDPAAQTQTTPSPEESAAAPAAPPEPGDGDQPQEAKAQGGGPLPATPQPFVPLEAAFSAATQDSLPAEAAAFSAAAQDSLPAGTAPAPEAAPLDGPAPAGAQRTPRQSEKGEGEAPGLLPPGQPAEEQPLAPERPGPQAPPQAGGQRSSTDLLSFDELLRPDLNVEVSPEPVLDQLQQAVNTALLEETAQLVMPQVVRGLATLVSEGMSEMRLQLMPEDLGEIEVRVRTSEGVVRGELLVQNPEIKQLLDQHLDRLRNALHLQGLDLRDFDVGLAPEGRFGQPDRSGQGAQAQRGSRRQAALEAPGAGPLPLAPRGAREVDYLA